MALGAGRGGTTMVLTVMVIVGIALALASLLRPLIPLAPSNARLLDHGDFPARGARQTIRWQPGRPAATKQSRLEGRPLLIVLSREGSPAGLQLDSLAFSDPEMADLINREFVPVRIDLDEEPSWESIILPFRRLNLGAETGFEVFIADPDRGLAAWTAKLKPGDKLDFSGLASFLQRARQESKLEIPSLHIDLQKEWRSSRSPSAGGSPESWSERVSFLLMNSDWTLSEQERIEVQPLVWSALLASGHRDEAQRSFLRLIQSPLFDAVSETWFSYSDSPDGRLVSPIKLASTNWGAFAFAARLSVAEKSPMMRQISKRLAEAAVRDFASGSTVCSSISDPGGELPGGSAFSIKPGGLWGFDSAEQTDLHERLGLTPALNPRMIPYPKDLSWWLKGDSEFRKLVIRIQTLREGGALRKSGVDLCTTTSFLASHVLETSLLLGDKELMESGRDIFAKAQLFRSGPDGVVQERRSNGEHPSYLTSSLAYAQACLMKWNLDGDESDLRDGAAVLLRGLKDNTVNGKLCSRLPGSMNFWPKLLWPLGWMDSFRSSDLGLALYLTKAYGMALRDPSLLSLSNELTAQYSGLLALGHPKLSGLAYSLAVTRSVETVFSQGQFRKASENPTQLVLRGLPEQKPPVKTPATN